MRPDRVNRGRESEDTGFRHHPALRRSRKATVPARLFNWEIINARRPTGGERARASACRPAYSPIPSNCRYHGRPLQACRVAGRRNRSASRAGGGPGARCQDPARGHERGLRRQRHARRLGLEGRLRSGRGRDGAVHPALRPPHAPRGGRWSRPRQGGRRNSLPCSSSPLPCRSPTPRCKPPPSGPATSCWNPRPAPACSPSWPNAPSASAPMTRDRRIPCT